MVSSHETPPVVFPTRASFSEILVIGQHGSGPKPNAFGIQEVMLVASLEEEEDGGKELNVFLT